MDIKIPIIDSVISIRDVKKSFFDSITTFANDIKSPLLTTGEPSLSICLVCFLYGVYDSALKVS